MLQKFGRIYLVLIAILGLWGCMNYYVEPLGLPEGSHYEDRGAELAQGLAACGFCHGQRPSPRSALVGGRTFYDLYGKAQAANITPAKTGLADWDTKSFLIYFRQFKDLKGKEKSAEFHRGYEWLSDRDLHSLVAYLATLQPIEQKVPRRKLSWWDRNITGFWQSNLAVWGTVPEIGDKDPIAKGQYLLDNVARCSSCHNGVAGWFSDAPYLAGRELRYEDGYLDSPALLGKNTASFWSEDAIVTYLQTGQRPDGKKVDITACPIEYYTQASQTDLRIIAKYLNSLAQ